MRQKFNFKKIFPSDKKGEGIVTGTINGIGGLIITVVLILVVVSTILGANLLGTGTYNTTAQDMASNFTEGINNVSEKIPTILLIAAVVLLFGVLVLLIARARMMWMGTAGGGTL